MKKFLSILAAMAIFPAAANALCPEPNLSPNDTVLSLLPNENGNTMSGPASNVGSSHRRWRGTLYYSQSDNMLLVCDGANWVDVVAGQYGQNGTDGTGTAGTGAPSKSQFYGPFHWVTGERTFGSIQNGQPSNVVAKVYLTNSDASEGCAVDTVIGGAWRRVLTVRGISYMKENSNGDSSPRTAVGEGFAEVRAFKKPNGQYDVLIQGDPVEVPNPYYGNTNSDYDPEYTHDTALGNTVTGGFQGRFRSVGDSDCKVSMTVENTNE